MRDARFETVQYRYIHSDGQVSEWNPRGSYQAMAQLLGRNEVNTILEDVQESPPFVFDTKLGVEVTQLRTKTGTLIGTLHRQ